MRKVRADLGRSLRRRLFDSLRSGKNVGSSLRETGCSFQRLTRCVARRGSVGFVGCRNYRSATVRTVWRQRAVAIAGDDGSRGFSLRRAPTGRSITPTQMTSRRKPRSRRGQSIAHTSAPTLFRRDHEAKKVGDRVDSPPPRSKLEEADSVC